MYKILPIRLVSLLFAMNRLSLAFVSSRYAKLSINTFRSDCPPILSRTTSIRCISMKLQTGIVGNTCCSIGVVI